MEFGKACEDLSWNHCTSTPQRSETNGFAERAVRRVKEGTSAVLLQPGLNEKWWADSMECKNYLRNIQDLLSDEKTPYERRFGQPFKGPIIPFGSLVEYHPITAKDQSRIHQFGNKVLPGLFLGYALHAERILKGDVLVADLEELETMDASEIYSKRLNAKEVIFHKQGEFIFPIADGRIKPPGGDQELRTSTLIREHPIRGESQREFLGESEASLPPLHDSFPDAGEAINDFWSMSGNFIRWTQSQALLAEIRIIPYSTEVHWRLNASMIIGISMGQEICLIIVQVSLNLFCWKRNLQTDICGPGGDWQNGKWHPGQTIYGQNSGRKWERMPSWRRSKSGRMKSTIWIMHENCEGSTSLTRRIRNSKRPSRILERSWKHQSLLLCVAKNMKNNKNCWSGASNKIKKQDLRAFWKLVNLQDCVWENHYQIIMKTILQEKVTIHYSIKIWFTNLFLCLKPWRFPQQKQQWTRTVKNWRKFSAWNLTKVRSKKEVIDEARTKGAKVHSPHWWTYVIWKMLNWRQSTKNTKVELYSEVIL